VTVSLEGIGKKFRLEWIFQDIQMQVAPGDYWAVMGPNGSGKSTLMKILSGHLSPSEGKIQFTTEEHVVIDPNRVYRSISYAAPYIELIEDFTLLELLRFHQKLKPFLSDLDVHAVCDIIGLPGGKHKALKYFSSGMKQRVKLGLAMCCDTPLVLLDEPTTNLDKDAIQWYHRLVREYALLGRSLVVATNEAEDVVGFTRTLHILEYKKRSRRNTTLKH
jgi:ABC-type multidrug transport system ATPase subunit